MTVDARLVAATNRDLEEEVRRGAVRGYLYYRLNVIAVHLPPLRERRDDTPALIAAAHHGFETIALPGMGTGLGGVDPADVPALADAVAAEEGVVLRGLMAVAPRGAAPGPAFARLAALAGRVRADHPEARDLSAGMSADLEAAIAAGSTLLRVGTALFGSRPLASRQDQSHPSHGSQRPG